MHTDCARVSYSSPLGLMILEHHNGMLTRAYFSQTPDDDAYAHASQSQPRIVKNAFTFLDEYFWGTNPSSLTPPPLCPHGTSFQQHVWGIVSNIPFGSWLSYGQIAQKIEEEHARRKRTIRCSAQAVGQAVGKNPLALFIPCHRVFGKNGALTGYAWGLERKKALAIHENIFTNNFEEN